MLSRLSGLSSANAAIPAAYNDPHSHTINLPLKQVLSDQYVHSIKHSPAFFENGNIQAKYDQEYNTIRVTFKDNPGAIINIRMQGEHTVKTIAGIPDLPATQLSRLVDYGLLQPSLLATLNISESQLQIAREQEVINQKINSRLQINQISSLPSIEQYPGSAEKTKVVLQGQAHFIDLQKSDSDIAGLYTFGAGPCAILIAFTKDNAGNLQQIGMGHIDNLVKEEGLNLFFSQTKSTGKLNVAILGGEQQTAARIIQAADRAGAEIVFACANFDQSRNDAASVDRQGQIYYGNSFVLNKMVNPQALHTVTYQRLSNPSLSLFEQLKISHH